VDFGKEPDLAAEWRATPGISVRVEDADYRAGDPAAGRFDTRRLWLSTTLELGTF
jgi:hypothetical protein